MGERRGGQQTGSARPRELACEARLKRQPLHACERSGQQQRPHQQIESKSKAKAHRAEAAHYIKNGLRHLPLLVPPLAVLPLLLLQPLVSALLGHLNARQRT